MSEATDVLLELMRAGRNEHVRLSAARAVLALGSQESTASSLLREETGISPADVKALFHRVIYQAALPLIPEEGRMRFFGMLKMIADSRE
jgi:hypothetical protein